MINIGNVGNISRALRGARRRPPPSASATPMDMFWQADPVPGTFTIARFNTQIFGGDGGVVTSDDGDPNPNMAYSAGSQMSNLRSSISVGGTVYTGAGATGFAVDMSADAFSAMRYTFGTPRDNILVGFFFKVSIAVNFTNYDFVNLEGQTGTRFAVFGGRNNGTPFFYVHTDGGVGPTFNVVNDELYWVQIKYERGVAGSVGVWRVSDWTQIGTSTLAFGGSEACARIIAPHFNGHGATQAGLIRSDNYVFKYTGTVPAATALLL